MIYINPTPLSDEEMAEKYGDGLMVPGGGAFLGPSKEKVVDYGITVTAAIAGAMLPVELPLPVSPILS